MGKLSPKPIGKVPTKTWQDLDDTLQRIFKDPQFDFASISLDEYIMSKEEIISEMKLAGYSPKEVNETTLEVY